MSIDKSTADSGCPHNSHISCGNCRLGTICLPLALENEEVVKLEEIVQRGRPLQKGEHVYREHDQFTAVFAVRSGSFKAYKLTDSGKEQVTGFYFPGEVFGMDGISKDIYTNSAKALETSAVCEIPFNHLEQLSVQIPTMQRHFFQLMSQEITEDQQLITLLSKNTAEERIAALLLSVSARNARRQLSATCFRLPMSRADIGNYMGITVETVSRVFTRFAKLGLIEVDSKEVNLLNIDGLKESANIT